jgi:hypothetical protein
MYTWLICLLFLQAPIKEHPTPAPLKDILPAPAPIENVPHKEYLDVIAAYEACLSNIEKDDTYKDFKWRIDNKEIGFSELSDVDKGVFILTRYQRVSLGMINHRQKWQQFIFNKFVQKDEKEPGNKDLVQYLERLINIHKKLAHQYEAFVEKFFTDNKSSFTAREIVYYKKNMHLVHKNFALIEEKK